MQPPSVTALVDRLERMALVERGVSDDLRVRMVALTEAGRKRLSGIMEEHPAQVKALFSGLSAVEMDTLHELLGKLGSHLATLTDHSGVSPELSAEKAKVLPHSQRSTPNK